MNEQKAASPEALDSAAEIHAVVTIRVDGVEHRLRSGSWIVSKLKKQVGVTPDRVLEQVVDGHFVTLQDDQTIEIKGGEIFVSHVPQGGSA